MIVDDLDAPMEPETEEETAILNKMLFEMGCLDDLITTPEDSISGISSDDNSKMQGG